MFCGFDIHFCFLSGSGYPVFHCFTDNLFPQAREFGHVKGPATAEESERLWAFRQFLAVPFGCV